MNTTKADVPREGTPSQFRVEKQRASAVLTLSGGQSIRGNFFVAGGSARHAGPERIGDVLNAEAGFFPFEMDAAASPETILVHHRHVVTVVITENEASQEPGYSLATRRRVSLLLSNGRRLVGTVHVYRPEGRDRLTDWAQHGERFRYIETTDATIIVNIDHVLEAREVIEG